MKNLTNKATSLLSGAALFAASVVMAGIGLATISILALFALTAVGVALLVSPFVAVAPIGEPHTEETVDAAASS